VFALSSSWNAFKYENAKEIFNEIISLGFNQIELSFNLTKDIVKGIKEILKTGKIKITGLHNFCPIPDGLTRKEALPDCYSIASVDEEARKKAVFYTKRTIDTAYELNAPAIVMHCGRVELEDKTRQLINLFRQGKKDSIEFTRLKDQAISERQEKKDKHFQQALRSLDELNKHAEIRQIKIGVETRFYFREIPSLDETISIFEKFAGSQLYYWHDTGHGQVIEELGFAKHIDYLNNLSQYLLGLHLHDIKGCQDHMPPGTGDFDFSILRPFLKERLIKVIEAHRPATGKQVIDSREFLKEKLYGN
jgi:sugar phosphate isomerase/epimerase